MVCHFHVLHFQVPVCASVCQCPVYASVCQSISSPIYLLNEVITVNQY